MGVVERPAEEVQKEGMVQAGRPVEIVPLPSNDGSNNDVHPGVVSHPTDMSIDIKTTATQPTALSLP